MRFTRTGFVSYCKPHGVDFRNLTWGIIARGFSGKCYSINKTYFKERIILIALKSSLKVL